MVSVPDHFSLRLWSKCHAVHSIGDHRDLLRADRASEHLVLLPSVRHADGVAGVCERELEKRVGDDGRGIAEHKQGVVSKHGPQAEQGRDHQGLVGQAREG